MVIGSQNDTFMQAGGTIIEKRSPDYPTALRDCEKCPEELYVFGQTKSLGELGIGLCGSRDACETGLRIATAVGQEAARLGLVLVSGYAKGADTAGHIAAIKEDGRTTAVLAEGFSGSRGFRLREEYSDIVNPLERMNIISQFPINSRWQVWKAMKRNQTICAFSSVLVAIEPGVRGGTLDAAQKALKQNKQLIVVWPTEGDVPAHVTQLGNKHCATLTRDEAETVRALKRALDEPEGEPSLFDSTR